MSEHETIFAIPEHDSEFLARIIEAVPDDWSDVTGRLEPTPEMLARERVERHTGYKYHRHDLYLEIALDPHLPSDTKERANPVGLLVEGKLPGFVSFLHTGYDFNPHFVNAKRLAAGFVRKGYRGTLSFNNGRGREYGHEIPAELELRMKDWERWEGFDKPRRAMPPAAVLKWNPRYGGKPEHLDAVLRVCQVITFN